MTNNLELRYSPGRGEGVFALRAFSAGETVLVGVIDKYVNRNDSHASQIGEDEFVYHTGLAIKVNHSCNPNCGISVNETGAHDYVARKDISLNEEITFDYAMQNYTVDYFPGACMCGEDTCRGTITGWKDLPADKKREYRGLAAPYLEEMGSKRGVRKSCASELMSKSF